MISMKRSVKSGNFLSIPIIPTEKSGSGSRNTIAFTTTRKIMKHKNAGYFMLDFVGSGSAGMTGTGCISPRGNRLIDDCGYPDLLAWHWLYLPSPLLTKEGKEKPPSPLAGEGWGEGGMTNE